MDLFFLPLSPGARNVDVKQYLALSRQLAHSCIPHDTEAAPSLSFPSRKRWVMRIMSASQRRGDSSLREIRRRMMNLQQSSLRSCEGSLDINRI